MKKGFSFFYISLALLTITLFSCKLKIEEEDLYDKPGVNVTNNQITLIIPMVSKDTKYINVYRKDKQNDKIINIGVLYHPQALENDGKNYCYIDSLITKEHSYEYRVRYYISGEYYYSQWSDTIYIEDTYNAYEEDVVLKYKPNGASLIYEKTDYTLTFYGEVQVPEFSEYTTEHYKPMLIVQSSKYTQAFELPSIADDTQIALRSMLSADFLDTDITIKGIVAQKTIFADGTTDELEDNDSNNDKQPDKEKLKKTIIWTEPIELDLIGAGSAKTINIPSQTGSSGLDISLSVR